MSVIALAHIKVNNNGNKQIAITAIKVLFKSPIQINASLVRIQRTDGVVCSESDFNVTVRP